MITNARMHAPALSLSLGQPKYKKPLAANSWERRINSQTDK